MDEELIAFLKKAAKTKPLAHLDVESTELTTAKRAAGEGFGVLTQAPKVHTMGSFLFTPRGRVAFDKILQRVKDADETTQEE